MLSDTWRNRLAHPAAAMAIGLVFFPLAKVLYIPNYVFNFLATLVHEIGHSVCAWLVGMPSIPTVSIAGGGVAIWQSQKLFLCLIVLAGLAYAAVHFRRRRPVLIGLILAIVLYPLLAFTSARELVAIAGGVLFEIGGAVACFYVVMAVELKRPFERTLYALWGWWMLLNRGTETVLMISKPGYWSSQTVIESGLAAGMTSDLEILRGGMGLSPTAFLWIVLLGCLAALPAAVLAAWLKHRIP